MTSVAPTTDWQRPRSPCGAVQVLPPSPQEGRALLGRRRQGCFSRWFIVAVGCFRRRFGASSVGSDADGSVVAAGVSGASSARPEGVDRPIVCSVGAGGWPRTREYLPLRRLPRPPPQARLVCRQVDRVGPKGTGWGPEGGPLGGPLGGPDGGPRGTAGRAGGRSGGRTGGPEEGRLVGGRAG